MFSNFCLVLLLLRLGDIMSLSERGLVALIVSVILSFPIFIFFGLYKAIFRFSGFHISSCFKSNIVWVSLYQYNKHPESMEYQEQLDNQPLILFILISSWRMFIRYWLVGIYTRHWKNKKSKALVYGSGNLLDNLLKRCRIV